MATTRLMPLHTGKGRSISAALGHTTNYVKNPDKTDKGEWISAYGCNPAIVEQEFQFSKRQYAATTGREQKEKVNFCVNLLITLTTSIIIYNVKESAAMALAGGKDNVTAPVVQADGDKRSLLQRTADCGEL